MALFEIVWEAPEFEYREKTVSWYWLSILVAALIIGFSVWQKNFLFGFFVLIAEMLFIVWGNRKPRAVHFVMNDTSLTIDNTKHYLLKNFESISVDTSDPDWSEIIFYAKARLKTPLKIMFPNNRLNDLRAKLKAILKEIPYEPTVIDAIEKLLRF